MFYNTLGFQMHTKCFGGCSMCSFSCNATSVDFLPLPLIHDFIKQAADQRHIQHIAFSGGDPFLRYEDLRSAIQHASSLHLETSCFTNAFWCKNSREAETRIRELEKVGLDIIRISLDYQHTRHIPVNNYRLLLQALRGSKIKTYINIGILKSPEDRTFDVLKELGSCLFNFDMIFFPFMQVGRAERIPPDRFYREIHKYKLQCPHNTILAVRANGNVFACDMCLDNFNQVGNVTVNTLDEIIRNARQDDYHRLVQKRGLCWIARMIDSKEEVPGFFTSPCEFCKWLWDRRTLLDYVFAADKEMV